MSGLLKAILNVLLGNSELIKWIPPLSRSGYKEGLLPVTTM